MHFITLEILSTKDWVDGHSKHCSNLSFLFESIFFVRKIIFVQINHFVRINHFLFESIIFCSNQSYFVRIDHVCSTLNFYFILFYEIALVSENLPSTKSTWNGLLMSFINKTIYCIGSSCGSVGRVVALNTRGLRFKSSHQIIIIYNI